MTSQPYLFNGPEQATCRLILAHGAGAPMDSPFMNSVAEGIGARGFRVIRFEFPYMRARRLEGARRGPDRASVLEQAWLEVIAAFRGEGALVIGGKSMGGRYASMLADRATVDGLVCFGYPFHPPGKPENRRTGHLAALATPTLILQGRRDPMGTTAEVAGYSLSPAINIHWLEDGDHSFKPRKKSGRTEQQNLTEAIAATAEFLQAFRH